jgi:hypothetical protein
MEITLFDRLNWFYRHSAGSLDDTRAGVLIADVETEVDLSVEELLEWPDDCFLLFLILLSSFLLSSLFGEETELLDFFWLILSCSCSNTRLVLESRCSSLLCFYNCSGISKHSDESLRSNLNSLPSYDV